MSGNQNLTPLFDALKKYDSKNVIPFDVPGHKHGKGSPEFTEYVGERLMRIDVNSMKPLDNISNPISVIKEAEELMAEAYFADHAFFLVNGTTSGVQAMIMSVCKPGESAEASFEEAKLLLGQGWAVADTGAPKQTPAEKGKATKAANAAKKSNGFL